MSEIEHIPHPQHSPETAEVRQLEYDLSKEKLEFDGGNFIIEFLSPSPEGFEIQTRQSLLRHAPNTPLPEAKRIRIERDKEPKKLRVGPGFKPMVGLRNAKQHGNILSFDIQPVTFPTYKAISNPLETAESLAVSDPTGTASALLTTEANGAHKIILQHRSPKNFFYGDVPGASIAGMFSGQLDSVNRGRLAPIDTDTVKDNNRREMFEELGLEDQDIIDVRITGVAKDKVRIHKEFLLSGRSPLSAEQIGQKAEAYAKTKKPDADYDFAEKFFVIDGTPEAIEKLLSRVKCPLPPTHTATFVAAGYLMVIEQSGLDAANVWKQRLEPAVQTNYREMDEQVATHWKHYPEKAKMRLENKSAHNLQAYDPAYKPSDQGLPELTDELIRVGLIAQEKPKRSELEKKPHTAWLFDVDGVITDPEQKRIKHPEIIDEIISRLQKGEPVAGNTGRSIGFVSERFLDMLEQKLQEQGLERSLLHNIYIIGEKGGTWLLYDENGERERYVNGSLVTPEFKKMQGEVRQLVQEGFSDSMFFDETKQTMISVEMNDGKTVAEFQLRRAELAPLLQALLVQHNLGNAFRVDATRIATDVESSELGKALGARQFVEIIRERGIEPEQFRAFGDSASDYEMAQELHRLGLSVEFVFVGGRELLQEKNTELFPITFTQGHCDEGTIEYLKANSSV